MSLGRTWPRCCGALPTSTHVWLGVAVAQHAVGRVRAAGTLLFMGGTGGRQRGPGLSLSAAVTAAQPALIANLAVEVAPIRVNLIAAGFVDTALSASLLGDGLQARRDELPRRSPSDAWSGQPTSPPSPCTS
jgi:NAD(P)-dependent dehydrogenase (short-subunit alcohol dehydrogenase family)